MLRKATLALGGPKSPDVIAQAAGVEFTAEDAAEILAPQLNLPNQPQVVEALANLWVDYFLLARVAAEDTTLETLDVSSLVEQNQNQELVLLLRDRVVQVDTAISEEELREALSAEHFVSIRHVHGGPAPAETRLALEEQRAAEARDTEWFDAATERLARAAERLRDSVAGARATAGR